MKGVSIRINNIRRLNDMFCHSCGQKVLENSKFCSFCGVKLVDSINNDAITSVINSTDERKGYSIYFNDICNLEFIYKGLFEKVENIKNNISLYNEIRYVYWDYDYNHQNYRFGNKVRFIYGYDGTDYYFYVQSQRKNSEGFEHLEPVFWDTYFPKIEFKDKHKLTPERLQKIRTIVTKTEERLFRIKEIPIRWDCDSSEFSWGRTWFGPGWLDVFESLYEKAQKEYLPQAYEEAQAKVTEYTAELTKMAEELDIVGKLLEQEYSLNIIPNKFRNLEAIWYICDYYDSSNESLKEILLHLDLDEIKTKLDSVIENQQQSIINQAIQISQNKTLIAQNQDVLLKLSDIEQQTNEISNNTAETTQWAKIAANNAEACAWIGVANYIK